MGCTRIRDLSAGASGSTSDNPSGVGLLTLKTGNTKNSSEVTIQNGSYVVQPCTTYYIMGYRDTNAADLGVAGCGPGEWGSTTYPAPPAEGATGALVARDNGSSTISWRASCPGANSDTCPVVHNSGNCYAIQGGSDADPWFYIPWVSPSAGEGNTTFTLHVWPYNQSNPASDQSAVLDASVAVKLAGQVSDPCSPNPCGDCQTCVNNGGVASCQCSGTGCGSCSSCCPTCDGSTFCGANSHWNSSQQKCIAGSCPTCDGSTFCGAGSHWNGTSCVASGSGTCPSCPSGKHCECSGTSCSCIDDPPTQDGSAFCGNDTTWDAKSGTCVSLDKGGNNHGGCCAVGTRSRMVKQPDNSYTIVCDPACDPGYWWDATAKKCILGCPDGYELDASGHCVQPGAPAPCPVPPKRVIDVGEVVLVAAFLIGWKVPGWSR